MGDYRLVWHKAHSKAGSSEVADTLLDGVGEAPYVFVIEIKIDLCDFAGGNR